MKHISIICLFFPFALFSKINWNFTVVERCPMTQRDWEDRGKTLKCSVKDYHCLRLRNYTLVEGCDYPQTSQFKDGCPWLEVETNNIKHERCDDGTPDCPPNSEEWLSSKDLYKFPGCFERPTTERFSMATNTKDITVSFRGDTLPSLIRNHSTTERTQTSHSLRNVLLSVVLGGAGVVLVILTVTAGTLIIIGLKQGHIRKCKRELSQGSQEENSDTESLYETIRDLDHTTL